MDTSPRTPTSIRVPIAWKFFALLALIIPSLLAVSWVGGRGMVGMKERLDAVYDDNLMSTQAIGSLSVALEEAEEMSLRLVNEVDRATIVGLDSELRQEVFPEVARRLNDVRVLSGPDSSEDGVVARSLEAGWGEFVAFANSRAFLAATRGPSDDDRTVSSTVERLSTSLRILTEQLETQETRQAQRAKVEAQRAYAHSLWVLRTIVVLGLLAGVGGDAVADPFGRRSDEGVFELRDAGRGGRAQHEGSPAWTRRAHGSRLGPERDGGAGGGRPWLRD